MFVSFHAKFLVHAFNAVLLGPLHYRNKETSKRQGYEL